MGWGMSKCWMGFVKKFIWSQPPTSLLAVSVMPLNYCMVCDQPKGKEAFVGPQKHGF